MGITPWHVIKFCTYVIQFKQTNILVKKFVYLYHKATLQRLVRWYKYTMLHTRDVTTNMALRPWKRRNFRYDAQYSGSFFNSMTSVWPTTSPTPASTSFLNVCNIALTIAGETTNEFTAAVKKQTMRIIA